MTQYTGNTKCAGLWAFQRKIFRHYTLYTLASLFSWAQQIFISKCKNRAAPQPGMSREWAVSGHYYSCKLLTIICEDSQCPWKAPRKGPNPC